MSYIDFVTCMCSSTLCVIVQKVWSPVLKTESQNCLTIPTFMQFSKGAAKEVHKDTKAAQRKGAPSYSMVKKVAKNKQREMTA